MTNDDPSPAPLRWIDELEQSSELDILADKYHAELGAYPLNVSHWDSSPGFRDKLMRSLRFTYEQDPLSYVFSEALDCQEAVLRKLGFDPATTGCVIVPNGTIATLCAVNWIASMSFGQMTVTCPNYFATLQQGRLLDLQVTMRYMLRQNGRYMLPTNVADVRETSTPLWVTNPVYCTGVLLAKEDVQKLRGFLDAGGTVLVDECVAWPGTEIGPELAGRHGFIGIYSPHKSVAINGLKFSALVFDRRYLRFFQQWTDVIHGGLGVSNVTAVKHFLSDNFSEYLRTFRSEVAHTFASLKDVVDACPGAELDGEANGQFAAVYIPKLPGDFDTDLAFMEQMMWATAGMMIPGRRSHFDSSVGACFRVNLTGDSIQFRSTLVRLLRYLTAPATLAHFA